MFLLCAVRRLFDCRPHPFVARLYQKLSRLSAAAEQSGEDCQVRQQDVAGARTGRRHPQEHIEFGVSGFGKWMRPSQDQSAAEPEHGLRLCPRSSAHSEAGVGEN